MEITEITTQAGDKKRKEALDTFLAAYLNPAFGALPKSEVELLILRLLTQIGAVSERPGVYELVSKLKITRTKARKLIYDQELRSRTADELDNEVRQLLRTPILQKRGASFAIEIENPLLSDHIREKLRTLGHVSDGSFSPNLVTLTVDAMVALLETELTEKQRDEARAALIKAGAPDRSFRGVLKGALKKLGEKIADDTGEAIAEEVSNYINPLLDCSVADITSTFSSLFSPEENV